MADPDSDRSRSSTASTTGAPTPAPAPAPAPGDAGGNAARVSGSAPAPTPAPTPGPGAGAGGAPPTGGTGAPPSREQQIETAITARDAGALASLVTEAAEVARVAERLAREADRVLETLATGAQANTWRRPAIATHLRLSMALWALTRTPEGKRDAIDEAIAQNRAAALIGSASIDSPDWAAALDDAKYQQLLNLLMLPVIGQTLFDVIWRLYGNGTSRSADCARLTWRALYTSRILAPGSLDAWSHADPRTSTNNGSTFAWRWVYEPVTPQDDAFKRLLVGVRPLPQGHVNISNIAFSALGRAYWTRTNPNPTPNWTAQGAGAANATSYYIDDSNSIVIVASGSGAPTGAGALTNDTAIGRTWEGTGGSVGGSAEAGAPALTYFLNHARHEVGHAVGHRAFQNVPQTGDDFALAYGGWTASNRGAFETAMWSASGNVVLDFSATGGPNNVTVTATVVRDWLMGLIVDKAQPGGNTITTTPGGLQAKFDIIRLNATLRNEKLVSYCTGVFYTSGFDPTKFQENGFKFPDHTPPDPVHLFCSRETPKGFWTYSKAAYTAMRSSHGWYSLSSHREMFAEIYTQKYSGGALPPEVNGKNPSEFFRQLEASRDTALIPEGSAMPPRAPGAAPAPAPGPAGSGPAAAPGGTGGGAGGVAPTSEPRRGTGRAMA